jgi:hypothetical protein
MVATLIFLSAAVNGLHVAPSPSFFPPLSCLTVHGCQDIGPDYAVTLRAWREAWEARQAEVLALGYSQRFWRKYRFYFAYCEAAFDARYIHTFQVIWVKDKEPTLTPEDMQRSSECAAGRCCAVLYAAVRGFVVLCACWLLLVLLRLC